MEGLERRENGSEKVDRYLAAFSKNVCGHVSMPPSLSTHICFSYSGDGFG